VGATFNKGVTHCWIPSGSAKQSGFVSKEAEMTKLRIDASKAERIIAQMLRDDQGLSATDAAALAARICRRLATAMPASPSLDCCRIISREPPDADEFAIAVAEKLNEKNERWNASELWELVYNQGRHLRMN